MNSWDHEKPPITKSGDNKLTIKGANGYINGWEFHIKSGMFWHNCTDRGNSGHYFIIPTVNGECVGCKEIVPDFAKAVWMFVKAGGRGPRG